jgi:hypothetical protein
MAGATRSPLVGLVSLRNLMTGDLALLGVRAPPPIEHALDGAARK